MSHLPSTVTADAVRALFRPYGTVASVHHVSD